jgi:long-subunit fatty acid transport protein
MRKNPLLTVLKSTFIAVTIFFSCSLFAQQRTSFTKTPNQFWRNVQFGGGIGLGFGSGYTDISLAPSAIYNFNEYVALGLGVQYTYAKQKNFYTSNLYGASIIGLFSPIKEIQLSAEFEQLRVNVKMNGYNGISRDYWNTGLFLGAGYKTGNVTIGGRYNVLDDNTNIYGSAFMPFVRVYF